MPDTHGNAFRFDLREANGALGDIGTLLPLAIGAIALAGMAAQPIFLGFAVFYIATGALYRLPVPVQPMKAVAALAIVGAVTPGAVALSGVLIGIMLLVLGATGLIDRVGRLVPQSVLSGLQLGLGLTLGWMALDLMQGQWTIAGPTLAVAIMALRLGTHAAVLSLGTGILAGIMIGHPGWPEPDHTPWTGWSAVPLAAGDLGSAVTELAVPQMALTLTNAVVLTAIVARDRFGNAAARVTPRRLCLTTGAANLLLAPFGALPMCHGAGGMAAHHRFGARSGGAAILIGAALGLLAALPSDMRVAALALVPAGALGALLLVAAAELAFSRRLVDARPSCRPVIALTALGTVSVGPLGGLIAGVGAEALRTRYVARRQRATPREHASPWHARDRSK